jgi:Tfp pilus assembly protein PilF
MQNLGWGGDLKSTTATTQKQFEEALRLDQKSLQLYELIEDSLGMATCLNNLSHLAEQAGDYASAGAWLNEALLRSRMASSWWLMAIVLANLGYIAQKQQRPHQALRYFQDSLILRTTHHLPGQEEMRKEMRRFSPSPSSYPAWGNG